MFILSVSHVYKNGKPCLRKDLWKARTFSTTNFKAKRLENEGMIFNVHRISVNTYEDMYQISYVEYRFNQIHPTTFESFVLKIKSHIPFILYTN